MATVEQIADLRRRIDELDGAGAFTDLLLEARIDASSSLNALAGTIWREKAASYATLTNITEGSSSRQLGTLYKNALEMAASYEAAAAAEVPYRGRVSRTRAIERL